MQKEKCEMNPKLKLIQKLVEDYAPTCEQEALDREEMCGFCQPTTIVLKGKIKRRILRRHLGLSMKQEIKC